MSKTSGTDEQVLSLPKGGGAVQGLGATFETDLNTGTGSYSIPLGVPAGPNGIQPQLMIRYHSAAGNGPFGLGWTLGIMSIARKTDGRIPDYGPDDNQFVLVGSEDLVETAANQYRPRVDTMHWRVLRQGNAWEVTDTQGIRHRLGQTAQARVETSEAGLTKTASWLLEDITDTNGNTVTYTYQADGAQRYLQRVEWGTYALQFIYEQRPDRLSNGRFGFLLSTNLRCARIELHVTTLTPSLARSWTLEYVQAPGSSLSLLYRITQRGHAADDSTVEVPPLVMGYTQAARPQLQRFTEALPGAAPGMFADGHLELLDWDGDGLPDLLEINIGLVRLWPNLGRGRWGIPTPLPQLPAPVNLDEASVAFADMEGNGTADLIMLDRPLSGYYPLRPGGGFDRPVFWSQAPAARLASGDAQLVDLNGDGITDLLVTGDDFFSLYLRDPADGWSARPRTIPRAHTPPVSFKDPRVRLADMNGDGLQDLVRVDGGGITYWPYLGNGRWADAVEMSNAPAFPRQFDPLRLSILDIDGDGCADLVYVDVDRVLYWFNQGGVRLSDARQILYTPPATPSQIRLADMNGTGTAGILWSAGTSGGQRTGYYYLDLMGGAKPYLLTSINNGLGLEARIQYRSSTEFALDAAEQGQPWHTFHPFPLQCVAQVEQHDLVSQQVGITRHRYHDGRYDGEARTFLGFATVDVENVGDDAIPTLRMRNTYHLGLDPSNLERRLSGEERQRLGALRRRLLSTEIYGLDGSPQQDQPYHIVRHEYDTRVEQGANGASVVVPFETRTLEEQWERGAAPFAYHEVRYLDIDTRGNITRQQLRVWRNGLTTADQDITTTVSFAINEDAHITSLPARVTQRDGTGTVISETVTHYDGPAHQGLPEGQVTLGNSTRKDVLVLPDELAGSVYGATQPDWNELGYHRRPGESGWWATQYSYDRQESASGLTVVTRNPRGFETRLEYDRTRQYLVRAIDALGNVLQAAVDERALQMVSLTDPNGQTTTDRFDALGRVMASIAPKDSAELPTVSFAYHTDTLPTGYSVANRIQHGAADTLDQVEYFNGRGLSMQKIIPGEGDAGRRFIVQLAHEYTVRGQPRSTYLPYYVDSTAYAPPPGNQPRASRQYDATGRLIAHNKVSGGQVTYAYRPGSADILDDSGPTHATPQRLTQHIDGLGRVLAVERPLAGRTLRIQYEYDPLNRIIRVEDPDGGVVRQTYDLLGRLLVDESQDTGRAMMVVDACGNLVERRGANGKIVHNRVDGLDRLVEVREEGAATPEATYTYLNGNDPAPPDGVQNRRGRLWQIQDRLGTLTTSYDERGNVLQTRRRIDTLGGRELVTDVVYDALGRQTRATLPAPTPEAGRRVVDYIYNSRGLAVSSPGYVRAVEYDVQGRITRMVYQNGVENRTDFDALTGLPQRLRVLGPAGQVLRDQAFTFDGLGNIQRIDAPHAVESGHFAYDDLDRLTEASYGSGEHYTYAYSDGGNITQAAGLGDLNYGTPGSAAVKSAGEANYSYDASGNLQSAPYGQLHFDGHENLVQVQLTNGASVEYVYDFQGLQVIRRVSGGGPETIFADPHVEYHNGQPVLWITFNKRHILALTGADGVAGVFVHMDILGTPTLYTDLAGNEVRRLAFAPYGTLRFDSGVMAGPPDGIRFLNQPFDDATGLVCLGRRYYDPRLGRFISPDIIAPGVFTLDGWNRFIYGHNNPLRYVDPMGLLSIGDIFAYIGVALLVAALVVSAYLTFGTTLSIAGIITVKLGGLLVGTAIGVAGGAIMGGISAAQAGGDIWKGILFGGAVGGVTAFVGGILGGGVFTFGAYQLTSAPLQGALQGALVGAGTGAAIGFAGGKGTIESFWQHVAQGALIGAITGAIFGLASRYVLNGNSVIRFGTPDKFDLSKVANVSSAFQWGNNTLMTPVNYGTANGGGIVSQFIALGEGPQEFLYGAKALQQGAMLSIPLGWVPNMLMNSGGIMLITQTSIALDKFGVMAYDEQLINILKLLPLLGFVLNFSEIKNQDYFHWFKETKQWLHNELSM